MVKIGRFLTVLLISFFIYFIYYLQLALFISNVVRSLYILYIPLILLYVIHDQILRLKIIVPKHIKYAQGWLPKTL